MNLIYLELTQLDFCFPFFEKQRTNQGNRGSFLQGQNPPGFLEDKATSPVLCIKLNKCLPGFDLGGIKGC